MSQVSHTGWKLDPTEECGQKLTSTGTEFFTLEPDKIEMRKIKYQISSRHKMSWSWKRLQNKQLVLISPKMALFCPVFLFSGWNSTRSSMFTILMYNGWYLHRIWRSAVKSVTPTNTKNTFSVWYLKTSQVLRFQTKTKVPQPAAGLKLIPISKLLFLPEGSLSFFFFLPILIYYSQKELFLQKLMLLFSNFFWSRWLINSCNKKA